MEDSDSDVLIKHEFQETSSEDEMDFAQRPKESISGIIKFSIIQELLREPFCHRSPEEQIDIIKKGRPCPELIDLKSIHRERANQYTRSFHVSQYELCDWLAGCDVLNKLFCWPCLLFNRSPTIWNFTGFSNLNNIHSSQRKHRVSVSHLQSLLMLAKFEGGINGANESIGKLMSSTSGFEHNNTVRKNLDVLKKMIDVAFMFLTRDIPFKNDTNRDRFKAVLSYFIKDEPALEWRLMHSDTFRDLPAIRDDILQAMTDVTIEEITKEIEESIFVSLMIDELHDANSRSRVSTIIRYVYKNNVFERFIGFTDMNEARTAESVQAYLYELMKRFKLQNKFIAQTYNGASSSGFDFDDLQKKLRLIHSNAHVVNCYAHILNDVLSSSLYHIKECEIFFSTLDRLASFTVHTEGSTETLIEYLENKLPSLNEGKWNFNSCWVYHVNVHRNEIIEFLVKVIETDERVDSKERIFAIGCLKFLNQFRTIFLLNLFSTIFNSSHKLFEMTQEETFDFASCKQKAEKFLSDLKNLRENGFKILWDFVNERFHPKQKAKRVCYGLYNGNVEQDKCKELFDEITDIVSKQTQMRFGAMDNFLFFELLNSERLKPYTTGRSKVCDDLVKNLNDTYPGLFDIFQIKNELGVLYNHTDFGDLGGTRPLEKLRWLSENKLSTSFDGVYKLCCLILTLPINCDPICSTDSCVGKVERYFRNSERMNRLEDKFSVLLIEKDYLTELKTARAFYDKVITKLVSAKKNTDFQFTPGTFY